ncbi:MAG: hypothetical protein D6677_05995 [Calditrichaeota bacterium]|nr:MAG: hypothetical protein D6677_05995 [Calditrichota bacterium]
MIPPKKETDEQAAHEFYNIPLLGEVRLQKDDFTYQEYDIGEVIANFRANRANDITLRAADDGLKDQGIFAGDYLTVRQDMPLKDGDICVVRLGYKIYVRQAFFSRRTVRLETSRINDAPLIIEKNTPGFEMMGKVIMVIREL